LPVSPVAPVFGAPRRSRIAAGGTKQIETCPNRFVELRTKIWFLKLATSEALISHKQNIQAYSSAKRRSEPMTSISPSKPKPSLFYGSIEIDMTQPLKSVEKILEGLELSFQKGSGTKLAILLEVTASSVNGFSDVDKRIAQENTKYLGFLENRIRFE
jgi:hypothetical protein